MPHFAIHHQVKHSADDMFALVADIESYPEFVPHCKAMHIISRDDENSHQIVTAKMTVGYGFLTETVTNRIVLDHANLAISVRATQGPFKRLENDWSFEPDGERSCIVHFSIAYEFRSIALRLVTGTISEGAFGNYSKAFEERADTLYGEPSAS